MASAGSGFTSLISTAAFASLSFTSTLLSLFAVSSSLASISSALTNCVSLKIERCGSRLILQASADGHHLIGAPPAAPGGGDSAKTWRRVPGTRGEGARRRHGHWSRWRQSPWPWSSGWRGPCGPWAGRAADPTKAALVRSEIIRRSAWATMAMIPTTISLASGKLPAGSRTLWSRHLRRAASKDPKLGQLRNRPHAASSLAFSGLGSACRISIA